MPISPALLVRAVIASSAPGAQRRRMIGQFPRLHSDVAYAACEELAGMLRTVTARAQDWDAPAEPTEARRAKGSAVLVVDDEPTVQMLATELLEEMGYIGGLCLPCGLNGRQLADAARTRRHNLKGCGAGQPRPGLHGQNGRFYRTARAAEKPDPEIEYPTQPTRNRSDKHGAEGEACALTGHHGEQPRELNRANAGAVAKASNVRHHMGSR